jgi:hypothetical protein
VRALVLGLACALAAAPLAAQGGSAKQRVKTTKRDIEAIGMDGPLVAYDLSARYDPGCNKVYTWNVNTNGGKVVSGDGTCEADGSSTGAGVTEIAVAGNQVAWITNEGGNTEGDDYLYTASLPKPKEKQLLAAMRYGDVDSGLDGDWISGLVGDGSLLAVGTYTTDGDNVSAEKLRVIRGNALKTVARGAGTTDPAAAGGGAIAVAPGDKTIVLYSAVGKRLRTFRTGGVGGAALTGKRLVTVSAARLQVFDTGTGKKLKAFKVLPLGASDLDAEDGIAVYAIGLRIYAVNLSTGKTVGVGTARGDLVGLEIEPPGVLYAYNTNKGGTLVLTPTAQVEAALR